MNKVQRQVLQHLKYLSSAVCKSKASPPEEYQ